MPQLPRRLTRWLLEGSDPSVRLRLLRGVLGRPADDPEVRKATREIGRTGWAARILSDQLPGGAWVTASPGERSLYLPKYIATNWRLIVLAELGASGADPRVRKAVDLFLRVYGRPGSGSLGGRSSEACFTGNAVRLLRAFGRGDDRRTRSAVDWIVRHQKSDGGWHCFPSRTGTLDAWEPLAGLAAIPPPERSVAVDRAIERGAEFYLQRGLLREGRKSYPPWLRLHYPNHYYYDLLVGLSLLVRLGYGDDRRLGPALRRLEAMRGADGSWKLDALHPDVEGTGYVPRTPVYPFALEYPGRPSAWITVSALEVVQGAARA